MNNSQVFLNTSISNLNFFSTLGNFFLAPYRFIFSGKDIIIERDPVTGKPVRDGSIAKVSSFTAVREKISKQEPTLKSIGWGYGVDIILTPPFMLVLLVPCTIIGSFFKGLSFLSPKVKEAHYTVKKRLTREDIQIAVPEKGDSVSNKKDNLISGKKEELASNKKDDSAFNKKDLVSDKKDDSAFNKKDLVSDRKDDSVSDNADLDAELTKRLQSGQKTGSLTINIQNRTLNKTDFKLIKAVNPLKLILVGDGKIDKSAKEYVINNWDNWNTLALAPPPPPKSPYDYTAPLLPKPTKSIDEAKADPSPSFFSPKHTIYVVKDVSGQKAEINADNKMEPKKARK